MTKVQIPDKDLGTFNDDGPAVYPACSVCRTPWAFRWVLVIGGSKWMFTRECKHKGTPPILLNRGGSDATLA